MYKQSPILTYYTLSPLPFLSITIYKLSKLINKKSIVVQENLSELSYLQTKRNYFFNNGMTLQLEEVQKEINNFVPQY